MRTTFDLKILKCQCFPHYQLAKVIVQELIKRLMQLQVRKNAGFRAHWADRTLAKESFEMCFWFFSDFSGCIRGGLKVDFLIIRDANQGACESDALADSQCGA